MFMDYPIWYLCADLGAQHNATHNNIIYYIWIILYTISSFSFMDFFLFFVQRSKKNARWHLDFAAEACIILMQAVEQTIPPKKN